MLNHLKDSRVVITERNAPRAVVLDYGEYEKIRKLVEMAEEGIQAMEIAGRKKRNRGRFLTHGELVAKLAR
jgi:PHD/YefM family antitoxin component YafN of YafNO toxin-antitoxin module